MKNKLYLYFEKINDDTYFISNDTANYLILNKKEFNEILNNKIESSLKKKLMENFFIVNSKSRLLKSYINYTSPLFSSPSLHIIVATLQCNHFCLYCRATNSEYKKTNINFKKMKKIIDFIFNTPNKNITIEFQGGEPLINWDVIRKSIEYSLDKNKYYNKDLIITIVTNLSLMDDDKLKFLIKNNISICTSLDGPSRIHNTNRLYFKSSSYDKVIYWLKKINILIRKINSHQKDSLPSALMTTTKYSLKYPVEIIDEYRKLKMGGIFIRPLSPIGYAKNRWDEIGYTADDFLDFYKKSIDYIISINKKGERFIERNAAIKLKKILLKEDINFLDLRSPCGAVIGQIAYNYDGDIYSCDEGRMVGATGDYKFRIGRVSINTYNEVLNSKNTTRTILSSILDAQIDCSRCAFKPYCGICPVFNYETTKKLYLSTGSYWCKIEKGIFKILIERLKDKKTKEIFMRWFDA